MYIFEDLKVYKKAVQLAAMIELTTRDFPKSTFYFVNRLVRSANLIHQNVASAHQEGKEEDRKNFYWRARGSIQECFGLIDVASRQGFISPNLRDTLRIQLDECNQLIQAAIRTEVSPVISSGRFHGPSIEKHTTQN